MKKSVDTNQPIAYTYLVSGKQPNDSLRRNRESYRKQNNDYYKNRGIRKLE